MNTKTTFVWYDKDRNEIKRTHPTIEVPDAMHAVEGAHRMVVVYDADYHDGVFRYTDEEEVKELRDYLHAYYFGDGRGTE